MNIFTHSFLYIDTMKLQHFTAEASSYHISQEVHAISEYSTLFRFPVLNASPHPLSQHSPDAGPTRRCGVLMFYIEMIIWTLGTWACVSERVYSHVRWGLRESQILGVLLFRLCVITIYQPIYHPLNSGKICHHQPVSCTLPPPPCGDFLL